MPVKKQTYINVKNVTFAYDGQRVLENITLAINAGEYVGIIGPNGGGKTTLLKLMLGLMKPTSGSIDVRLPRYKIGYVPQRAASIDPSFPATVREVVESGTLKPGKLSITKEDNAAIDDALRVTGTSGLARRRIAGLSGGERQRVLVARALAARPLILMLDEPTTAVDVKHQEEFYRFLRDLNRKQKIAVVMVSHDLDAMAHEVDRVICLNRHLVCHGKPEDVMKDLHIEHYGH
ncbi:MAG: metal ABC transporter ATP-binding protein [Candidatus Uhrbacteria bacterium]|nr:metal ABC transporter ATP-binding protein [Candidatus Uhrbacteria bacterium]